MILKKSTSFLYWPFWLCSFYIASHYEVMDILSFFFFMSAAVSKVYLARDNGKQTVHKNYNCRYGLLWISTAFLTFSLFGRSIFMQTVRMTFYAQHFLAFFVLLITLFPISHGIIQLGEFLGGRCGDYPADEKQVMLIQVVSSMVVFLILLFFSWGHFPCTMTGDSYTHWKEAHQLVFTDWSPVAFNILLKLIFNIFNAKTPYSYCVFQIMLFSLVVGDAFGFLRRKGVSQRMLLVLAFFCGFFPTNSILLMYLSKNPLTAILNLEVLISLVEAVSMPSYYLANRLWTLKTIISISFLYLVRDNNVVIILPIVAFSIWYVINGSINRYKVLLVVSATILIVGIVQGVIYKRIEYIHEDKSYETVRPLVAPIGMALQQNIDLPNDIFEVAEKVLPVEEWISRYDSYNTDPLTWGSPYPHYSSLTLSEAFYTYLKMLTHYPDIVIRDRLDGMDLIWNIRGDNYRYPLGIPEDIEFRGNHIIGQKVEEEIKHFSESLLFLSDSNAVLDMFVWKNGIYVFLLMVTLAMVLKNEKAWLIWAILPSVAILLTYVLVIAWQMYFYIWFFPLAVLFWFIICSIECGRDSKELLN